MLMFLQRKKSLQINTNIYIKKLLYLELLKLLLIS